MLENVRKDRQDAWDKLQAANEEQHQRWDRLKSLKDTRIAFSEKGKVVLATAAVAPAVFENIHLPGNMGWGLTGAAILFSVLQGDKAFSVGRWLKEKLVADSDLPLGTGKSLLQDNDESAVGDSVPDVSRRQSRQQVGEAPTLARMQEVSNAGNTYLNLSETLAIHADEFLAERKLIVGVSGSGKSNSVAICCESLGELDVPFVLFDTENEYESLCDDKYLPRWQRLDSSNLNKDTAEEWAGYILDNNIQTIVNLQDFSTEDAAWIMINMIEGLTKWQEARPNDQRIPCEIILEEATTWLPQNKGESQLEKTTLSALQSAFFNDVVRKGRKRGLGFTVVCQKIAELDKCALQCGVKVLHEQTELNDLKRYEAMGISSAETLSLKKGEAFVWVGRIAKKRVQVRLRRSPHGAKTPTLDNLRNRQSSPAESGHPIGTTLLPETMEELPMKPGQEGQDLHRMGVPAKHQRALEVWDSGIQTVRPFADAMGMKETAAYNLLREMDSRGFIQMKKRGH